MLSVFSRIKIFVYLRDMDMRKGVDGLSGIIRGEFQADPTDGHMYLFINKRRDRLKILHFDSGGWWLYYRLLESGTFEALSSLDPDRPLEIDTTQLTMLLSGVSLKSSSRRRKRFSCTPRTTSTPPQDEAA
jgi:hypothetical protein